MIPVQYFPITNMKHAKHTHNSYPTRSLREYLAYRSVHHTEQEQEAPRDHYETQNPNPDHNSNSMAKSDEDCLPRIEVQVEVGDGRSQVIVVDQLTDIRKEAQQFCAKYHLQEYVSDLLAETIRDKYQMEKEERLSQSIALQQRSLTSLYSNTHPREVIADSESDTARNSQASGIEHKRRKSSEKGASKILKGSHLRDKKYSIGQAYLLQNKENQPELNKVSLEICQKIGKENILQHCTQRTREKYAAILKQRQAKEEEEMRLCPFHPQINPISKQVDIASSALSHTQPSRRFQRLYQDHKAMEQRREEERQQLMQQLPFRPALNYISRKIVESKRASNDSQEPIDHKPHNSCTHPPSNSLPQTGRGPKNRNTENLPIGEYLYAQAMKKAKPKVPVERGSVRALDHSDQLVAALKEKRINEVFTELTRHPHQELFCQDLRIQEESFRTDRLRLFMPIFMEMSELGLSVTRSEFLEASLALLKTLSPEEKHEVIFPKQKCDPHPNKSLTHSRSKEGIRRQLHEDLYIRGIEHRKVVEERNEQWRESRAREELRQCTFRPAIRHT